jgi:hypothetical protein
VDEPQRLPEGPVLPSCLPHSRTRHLMWVGYACGACFAGGPAHHEPDEVDCSPFL